MSALRAVVVVPARDEAARIGRCLAALGAQTGVAPGDYEVVVVLDSCRDGTAAAARVAAERIAPAVHVVESPQPGVGHARRHGMELACARLVHPDGLIASTDADTIVAPDWLAAQLALAVDGAEAIGGLIELDPLEARSLDPATLARRERRARDRHAVVLDRDPGAPHHFFSGASLALTVAAYRRAGGLEPRAALEDEALLARLEATGTRIVRSSAVRVSTSARTESRAGRGLARDLGLGEWLARRRYDGFAYGAAALREHKDMTISVVIPAKDCAATIEGVLTTTVLPLAELGLVDEVVVIDGGSRDGTPRHAAALGADVRDENDVLPEFGPALGKGDAMWRGLAATRGELVAYLDADTADPHPTHLLGLLGPLLCEPAVELVKGAFARPFRVGDEVRADEGGRVTELMARPLLNLHVPELAGFAQPLAGETAARRGLLEALPFAAGYGVEVALLIDALRHAGLDGLAESRLAARQNRHQPLRELGAMAFAVLCAVERRARSKDAAVPAGLVMPWRDGAIRDVPVLERPPLASLAPRALPQSA